MPSPLTGASVLVLLCSGKILTKEYYPEYIGFEKVRIIVITYRLWLVVGSGNIEVW